MNENQVSVGMMGVYEFRNCQTEKDILEADDITLLLLERGRTARQAIEMIGELIEEYGYTVSSIDGAAGAVAWPWPIRRKDFPGTRSRRKMGGQARCR